MTSTPEGYTEIENGVFADLRTCEERGSHHWQNSTSIHDARYSRLCKQCGKFEELGVIGDAHRLRALTDMAVLQATLKGD